MKEKIINIISIVIMLIIIMSITGCSTKSTELSYNAQSNMYKEYASIIKDSPSEQIIIKAVDGMDLRGVGEITIIKPKKVSAPRFIQPKNNMDYALALTGQILPIVGMATGYHYNSVNVETQAKYSYLSTKSSNEVTGNIVSSINDSNTNNINSYTDNYKNDNTNINTSLTDLTELTELTELSEYVNSSNNTDTIDSSNNITKFEELDIVNNN